MDKRLSAQFHALGDATRFAVVERLLNGPASVSELARPHAMALPPFMKHLGILERAGLIRSVKTGRVRICSLEPTGLEAVDGWVRDRRRLWSTRFDRLDDFLSDGEL